MLEEITERPQVENLGWEIRDLVHVKGGSFPPGARSWTPSG